MTEPLRVLLDSNAIDALALVPVARARVIAAVNAGTLVLVVSHVQLEEIVLTADGDRRRALVTLPVEQVPSAAFTLGDVESVKVPSRFGQARLASDEEEAIYRDVTAGNPRAHGRDARVLLTARFEGIPVVTLDQYLQRCCARWDVEVLTPDELLSLLPPS